MFSKEKPCSKRVSTQNLALLFHHEASIHSCFSSVCILRPFRPVTISKAACNNIGLKFLGDE